jgi:hypothetical protein
MAKIKEALKTFWTHAWELLKSSFLAMLFYGMASTICFMGLLNEEWTGKLTEGMNGTRIAWIVIAAVLVVAYHCVLSYANGSKGYEMLVSGNMKRLSAERLGSTMKISSHKEVQEYREWKGFVSGGIIAFFTVLFGVLMAANAEKINAALAVIAEISATGESTSATIASGTGALLVVSCLLSGWSILPFVFANLAGASVSYLWSCLFGILPILASGIMYIVGAYGKRAKNMKAQEEADRAAAAEAAKQKPKKINYGGLPGTKPNKKKK